MVQNLKLWVSSGCPCGSNRTIRLRRQFSYSVLSPNKTQTTMRTVSVALVQYILYIQQKPYLLEDHTFLSFDSPASRPATTYEVFFDTPDLTAPPWRLIRSSAASRSMLSKTPVTTKSNPSKQSSGP